MLFLQTMDPELLDVPGLVKLLYVFTLLAACSAFAEPP